MVARQLKEELPSIHVPILHQPIFADCEYIVRVGHKCYLHGAVSGSMLCTSILTVESKVCNILTAGSACLDSSNRVSGGCTNLQGVMKLTNIAVQRLACLHDRVLMSEDGFVTVVEVQAPDLDILVCRGCHQECAIRGDVHREDRQFMAIQTAFQLQAVHEQYLRQASILHCLMSGQHELFQGYEASKP